MESQDVAAQLKDFGFSEDQITVSLKHSSDKTIEGLINWLDAHPNIEEFVAKETAIQTEESTAAKPSDSGAIQAEEDMKNAGGKSISGLVNQEFCVMLESMGYSKNVREKALLMSGNSSVEKALEWIEEHRSDEDFEEELRVINEEEKPKMNPEEAAQKAKELQARLREIRKQKEIEEEREREKNRVASGKALADAKRIFEEQEQKRAVEQFVKQKNEDEEYKRKLLEEMEREKIARFGPDYAKKQQQTQSPEQKLNEAIKQMKRVYPIINYPDTVKICLQTIRTALANILKNPTELKFQKINLSNENFKKRVGDIIGGQFILTECAGFKEENGFLVLSNEKKEFFPKILELLDKEIFNLTG